MNIAILGAPGTGKGTISELITKHLGYIHISAGEILREEIANNTDDGKKLKYYVDNGLLAPDELVNAIMKKKILSLKDKNILLDGYPRQVEQAEYLKTYTHIDKVVNLQADVNEVIARLSNRRICKNGHTYNLITLPPKKEGVCDIDNLPLYQRSDDNPESIKTRYKVYDTQTKPVETFYKNQGLLHNIRAEGTPDEIFERVKKALN